MSFFNIPAEGRSFDAIFELAADAGAEDVEDEDGYFAVYGPAAAFKLIGDRLRAAGIQTETAELRMFPNQEMEIAADQAVKVLRVIETLEELDDVQRVDSNMAITDAALELLEA
jgi:transcriptional/translational regulatory protein YebC/TACO1